MNNLFQKMKKGLLYCFFLFYSQHIYANKNIHIHSFIDHKDVFLHEQILLTSVIHYNGEFKEVVLPPPKVDNALVFFIKRDFNAKVKMHEYEHIVVVQWAIFPLKTGSLHIPPLFLKGVIRLNVNDHKDQPEKVSDLLVQEETVFVQSREYQVHVKDAASNYQKNPCHSLLISVQQEDSENQVNSSHIMRYRITIEADGLPSELLPDIHLPRELYEHSVIISDDSKDITTAHGMTGRRIIILDLLPSYQGPSSFSELSIYWWDTYYQQEKISTISWNFLVNGIKKKDAMMIGAKKGESDSDNTIVQNNTQTLEYMLPVNKEKIVIIFLVIAISGIVGIWLFGKKIKKYFCYYKIERKLWNRILFFCQQKKGEQVKEYLKKWIVCLESYANNDQRFEESIMLFFSIIDQLMYARQEKNKEYCQAWVEIRNRLMHLRKQLKVKIKNDRCA